MEGLYVLVLVELAERVDAADVDGAAHDAALRLEVGPVQAERQAHLFAKGNTCVFHSNNLKSELLTIMISTRFFDSIDCRQQSIPINFLLNRPQQHYCDIV